MTFEEYPKMYLYRRIVQAKLFIDAHYAEQIDLDNISDEAYFSKFHLIRLFKQIYSKTPYQYLTALRIEKAALLLREGNSVSDVCCAVGFESLSSFGSLFKRLMHVTPSAFLETHLQLRADIRHMPLKFVPGCVAQQHGWNEK